MLYYELFRISRKKTKMIDFITRTIGLFSFARWHIRLASANNIDWFGVMVGVTTAVPRRVPKMIFWLNAAPVDAARLPYLISALALLWCSLSLSEIRDPFEQYFYIRCYRIKVIMRWQSKDLDSVSVGGTTWWEPHSPLFMRSCLLINESLSFLA